MSTIAMCDDASKNAIVRGPVIIYNSLNPIVISETTAIVITETQKVEKCHQRVKGSSLVSHNVQ